MRCRARAGAHRRLARAGDAVKTAARAVLARRDRRVFPVAVEQAHVFEAAQRAVERAVRGQSPPLGGVGEPSRKVVAVKLRDAGLGEVDSGGTDREFEAEQGARFSAHDRMTAEVVMR